MVCGWRLSRCVLLYSYINTLIDSAAVCVCVCDRTGVISAAAANITASSADVNSSSSSSGSVVRPSWLPAGCGLVLDPVLAMKLVATHDGLRNVTAVPLSSTVSAAADISASTSLVATTSSVAVPATVTSVTLTT